jgi:hypothetical protein
MGTWGTGPLGSDSAMDFLEEVAALPVADREREVARVVTLAADDPSSVLRDVLPEEVIAAATLIAEALPAGNGLPWHGEEQLAAARLASLSNTQLPAAALSAVEATTESGGWWSRSWVSDADRAEAEEAISALCDVLRSAVRETDVERLA